MERRLRNISASGALIVFPHSAITPREFVIHIPQREATHSAEIVWRRHDRAGIALSPMERFEAP
jgi:hypothetical protein